MDLKRNRIILLCILALMFPIVLFSNRLGTTLSVAALLGVLVLYLVGIHFLWRCPACGPPWASPAASPPTAPTAKKSCNAPHSPVKGLSV